MPTIAFAIAGSEASGGAGAQTDLKTFHQLGTFGVVALTCIVSFDPARNWDHRFVPVDPQVIRDQIEAATAVHDIDTVKIGMLGTVPTIEAVADELEKRTWRHVVLDPVLICKGQEPGAALDTDNALKERILPLATVVTPNLFECRALSGLDSIETVEDLKEAARRIHALGPRYVVAKGGAVGKFEGSDLARYLPDLMPTAATQGFKGVEGTARLIGMLEAFRDFTGNSEKAANGVRDFIDKVSSPRPS